MRKQTISILSILTTILAVFVLTAACDSRQEYIEDQAERMPTPSEERAEGESADEAIDELGERTAEEMGLDDDSAEEEGDPAEASNDERNDDMNDEMDNVLEEGEYDPNDVVRQPGAEVGSIAQCPVGGEVFRVTADSTYVDTDEGRVYFCCPNCIRRFQREPQRYLDTQDVAPAEQ